MPTQKLGPVALEVLTILSAPTNDGGMTSASIYSRCSHAKSMTQVTQTLGNLLIKEPALVERNDSGPSRATWIITPAGIERLHGVESGETEPAAKPERAKKQTKRTTAKRTKALAEPGIDPGHTDPEADEEEEEEDEIDFALWNSGVLAIQVGEDTFGVPKKHVGPLRDYLNKHAPNPARDEFREKLLEVIACLGLAAAHPPAVATFISQQPVAKAIAPGDTPITTDLDTSNNKPHKFDDFMNDQVRRRVSETPPAPPIPPAAYASAEPVVSAAPPSSVAPPPAPPPEVETKIAPLGSEWATAAHVAADRAAGQPAPTEPVGLPGVELDGPNGIRPEVVSHGMTRSEQFAETAARG